MERVEKSRILFLDEMPIRRLLEFRSEFYPVMLRVLDTVYERRISMVASPISLSNIAFFAHSKGKPVLAREYREFFTRSDLLSLREIDAEVASCAAEYRASLGIGSEEALQLATAYVSGADLVLTERESWKDVDGLNVVTLSELQSA